jgi:Flp pilus assembly protein TadG
MSAALVRRFRPFRWNTSSAATVVNNISRLRRDEGGAVALLAGLALFAICGAVGLAIDVGFWYRTHRAMQNAADAASIAAARDGVSGPYSGTGQAVAAKYGFVNGVDGTTVQIVPNQACLNGGTGCLFTATIDLNAAQFFSQVLDIPPPRLSASATAGFTGPSTHQYCLVALAGSGTNPAILTNGAPHADLNRCDIVSNTGMTCHGHDLNAGHADAVLTNNGCGTDPGHIDQRVPDPLSGLAGNILASGASLTRAAAAAAASTQTQTQTQTLTQWSGNQSLGQTKTVSGGLKLIGNTTVTTPAGGSILNIQDGTLDLSGYTLRTAQGSGLTVVFTSTTGSPTTPPAYAAYPTGGGMLDIAAPTTGTWSGVAIYLDPLTIGPQTIRYHGNSPTWKITGTVYMPHTYLIVSGAVGKSSNGGACIALIVDSIRINGTGSILVRPDDCASAGVTLPTNRLPTGSPALVL